MTDCYLLVATEATKQKFVDSRSNEEKVILPFLLYLVCCGNGKTKKMLSC